MHTTVQTTDLRASLATRAILAGLTTRSAPPSISELTLARTTVMQMERDEEIVAQDDPANYCYLVVSGCVRTVNLMRDGRRQIGEFLFPGDVFGWEALDNHDFGAEAVTPVTLRRVPRRELHAFADQNGDFARGMRELTARQVRAGRERMILLGRKTASERIASFLLEMADRIAEGGASMIELPMARGDIADYLGLTIETVCRRLTQLRTEGAITVKGTRIVIRDLRLLQAAGCEAAVH